VSVLRSHSSPEEPCTPARLEVRGRLAEGREDVAVGDLLHGSNDALAPFRRFEEAHDGPAERVRERRIRQHVRQRGKLSALECSMLSGESLDGSSLHVQPAEKAGIGLAVSARTTTGLK